MSKGRDLRLQCTALGFTSVILLTAHKATAGGNIVEQAESLAADTLHTANTQLTEVEASASAAAQSALDSSQALSVDERSTQAPGSATQEALSAANKACAAAAQTSGLDLGCSSD